MPKTTLLALLAIAGMTPLSALAQDTQYVTDQQFVPLRSGPSNQNRIVHRGIPSGTKLVVEEVQDEYSRITTERGTEGWIRTQYLMQEVPARQQLKALQATRDRLQAQVETIESTGGELQRQFAETSAMLAEREETLAQTTSELTEIKRLSANAIAIDSQNRELVQGAEVLNSRIQVLEADNQRLLDSADGEAFINGALAVLLGVIITLVVPRLRPRRKSSSSWA
ncbi:TIGR04211 family SH3 domain-containing protein [Candidatus Litorirhabdus singularis]|nr:TIGR04211 family SH3 domain-containing protein [Candidatus Litorirhabdus singularis]